MLIAFTEALIRKNSCIIYITNTLNLELVLLVILEIHCNYDIVFIAMLLGTYTTEESNDEGQFKFYFMTLAALVDAWNYCVPIILVDGVALKNKYFDTLTFTCTIDGNSQIVPLAFVVIDSENDLSWAWFFRNLKSVFRKK